MTRTTPTRTKATITLAVACTAALVFAVAAVQARPTRSVGAQAAAKALSDCTLVISGAPWHIRGRVNRSGNTYTLKGRDVSCVSVRARVVAFTHQNGAELGAFKGPAGFKCTSFSTAASGDTFLYSGACMHPPHNDPFFEWGPKVPAH
jgi:hypothetical protein